MPKPPSPAASRTAERYKALVRMLGYVARPTFLSGRTAASQRSPNHVIRQAFATIGVAGVFALEDGFSPPSLKPIVYIACANNAEQLQEIRKEVWSQGAVPFLLVVMPETLQICQGFEPPSATTISVDFDHRVGSLPEMLENFSADRISSSITWNDLEIHRDSSVDNNLVDAIEALNERARAEFPTFSDQRDLINALIGKYVYIYVLIDRQILSIEWLASHLPSRMRKEAQPFLQAIFSQDAQHAENWSAQAAMAVFEVVDGAINGSVFALSAQQRARIPDGLCHLIHRVVRCGEVLNKDGSQLGFFNVSFKVLRTETISAIYERFVSIEDKNRKRDEGVFYTPPHLADHVLDRLESVAPITNKSRVIDPAAGSGIFLVGAFRRLMERHAPAGGWQPRHIRRASELLLNTIHGIEKHPQAANVCRFSLYLTLLDYVGRARIEKLIRAAGDRKFLPDLSQNIQSLDAFAAAVTAGRYTHVVGNPPWPTMGGQKDRTNQGAEKRDESPAAVAFVGELRQAKLAVAHSRLSDLFTWLAVRRLAAEDGAIAFLLPARSVIGRAASNFAHCLAQNVTIDWVGNLYHLRRKLFEGVEAPACVLVATNKRPTGIDRASVYRPLLSSLPGGRRNEIWSLLASSVDVRTIRSADLQKGPSGWFVQCMLGELDGRMHEALKSWATMQRRTLGDFLLRSGFLISKGGSPNETGVRRDTRGDRSVQLHPLRRQELASVKRDFRGWFSGNVILIPRSMNEATYHRDPIAYPSTFNAIIPEAQYKNSVDRPLAEDEIPYLPELFVGGFLAYVNSELLRYFASLFGASYLLDKARLEKNDLLALPCPFEDMHDSRLLALASSDTPDTDILNAMKAGADFRAAFDEFAAFRKHFANAQVPPDSFKPAPERTRESYLRRLSAELQASFGPRRVVNAALEVASDRRTYVAVTFGRKPKLDLSKIDVGARFLGSSIVTHDRDNGISIIMKSPAHHAWTIDQAVADAVAVSREIRSAQ